MAEEAVSGANAVPSSSQQASPRPIGSSVIPIANKLQDIFAKLGSSSTIDLPQVAVVGSQSSGKSSVLEALVGRDFLPCGSDICTRRPLLLQLVHFPRRPDAPAGEMEEWGEFLHIPWKRFYDFCEIRHEIQAETDREAGGNKGVSEKQICLKIFSPNVLNITLVDLPGITKVPVGDQPSGIEAIIRTMILSYIKHETCIILAVSPANADLSKSDALQIARIADPNGSRTIGVITKLDIMDRGTDARNFLLGNVIPLRLGYVGVVNRSQQDINLNRSIKDALANEETFFRCQPVYHGLSHSCGVPKLAKKLNQILVQHIWPVLPELMSCIDSQLVDVAKEHAAYGDVVETKMDCIDTSHPNFIGRKKAMEIAQQQIKASRLATSVSRPKVNHTKRELHEICTLKLFREDVFDDLLRESADITAKRKMIRETLRVLQQAYKTLEELPLEADTLGKGYSLDLNSTGLPKI